MVTDSSDGDLMTITSQGYVGIGTTGPSDKLEIYGNGQYIRGQGSSEPSVYYWRIGEEYDYTNALRMYHADHQFLGVRTNDDMFLQPTSGNVGIGTTGPGAKLEVSGGKISLDEASGVDDNSPGIVEADQTAVDFLYNTKYINHYGFGFHKPVDGALGSYMSGYYGVDLFTGGANRLSIRQNGNVGIGTTSPDSKLDVAGNILASSSSNVDITLRSSSAVGDEGRDDESNKQIACYRRCSCYNSIRYRNSSK